jgi:pyruvate dehydrogenase E2 component (dihydrolipoamide acetyltransferase)
MPQLGETVADGTVTKWFKKVGDVITRGEPLFEVSTDKVDTEIPAPADGVLSAILVPVGDTVDVGTVLAVIGGDAAIAASPSPSALGPAVAPVSAPAPAPTPAPTPTPTPTPSDHARLDGQLSPVVRRLLAEHNLSADDVTGTGPQGRITRDDVRAHIERRSTTSSGAPAPLSPVVRRLLADHHLDPATIRGTGAEGRLTRRDVEDAITRGVDEVVPFTRIRRLTAEHMVRSKATSAHTLMVREVDYENVESTRRSQGAAFKDVEGFALTYFAFNAAAVLSALRDFPHLNASVGDDALIVHHDLNLAIAVDLDEEGLVAPVLHRADQLDLRSLARSLRDLATRARSKQLKVDDFAGGTFTVSNPGPFGTLLTGAVINQPQVAILSTDAVTRRPVVVTDASGVETLAIHSVGLLALTFDHRAVDGAYAARFLARVAEILVTRDWSSEL